MEARASFRLPTADFAIGARVEARYAWLMSSRSPLRRLIDLPGVADLEHAAVLKPLPGIGEARPPDPRIDACAKALFGLTPDEAEALARPDDWDGIEDKPIPRQVAAFEAAGWDVTDNKRRPLRTLVYLGPVLWLAVRGVAGELPFQAEPAPDSTEAAGDWGADLAAEAARFRKR